MFDFLKPRNDSESISLNLKSQVKPPAPSQREPEVAPSVTSPQQNHPGQADIERCALELIKSGYRPATIFFLRAPGTTGPLCLQDATSKAAALVFTSLHLAVFFAQGKTPSLQIVGVKLDEFPSIAQQWQSNGIDSFVMNLSPKSPTANILKPDKGLIAPEQLVFTGALHRAIRNWQAQRLLGEFYSRSPDSKLPLDLKRQRAALETLRDSGAYDIPFIHWMIAILAGTQDDEPARLAATAVLETFGPAWVGKTAPMKSGDSFESWGNSVSTATTGLLAEFGMLKNPDGTPMKSILQIQVQNAKPAT